MEQIKLASIVTITHATKSYLYGVPRSKPSKYTLVLDGPTCEIVGKKTLKGVCDGIDKEGTAVCVC